MARIASDHSWELPAFLTYTNNLILTVARAIDTIVIVIQNLSPGNKFATASFSIACKVSLCF